jgi:NADH:ubiquinone oxidoreductase subunit E
LSQQSLLYAKTVVERDIEGTVVGESVQGLSRCLGAIVASVEEKAHQALRRDKVEETLAFVHQGTR